MKPVTYAEYVSDMDFHERAFYNMSKHLTFVSYEDFIRTHNEVSEMYDIDCENQVLISDICPDREIDPEHTPVLKVVDGVLYVSTPYKHLAIIIPDGATHVVKPTPQEYRLDYIFIVKLLDGYFYGAGVFGWERHNHMDIVDKVIPLKDLQ